MSYLTGTATSVDQFVEVFLNFATKTVGRFSDPFKGGRGLSSFQIGGLDRYTTFALQHNDSGAFYLFDFVPGDQMNNTSNQHVLVGQLMPSISGARTFDYEKYDNDEELYTPEANCTWTLTESGGVYTFTATMTAAGPGAISSAEVGFGLVIKDSVTAALRHIFVIDTASVAEAAAPFDQVLTCTYVGSINQSTGVTSTTPPTTPASGDQDDFLLSSFSVYSAEQIAQTRFGDFTSNMWGQTVPDTEIADGWFPRSGRLNFNNGVNYHFFGSGKVNEQYFHMVLSTDTLGYSHWWMGKTMSVGGPTTIAGSSAGVFLGTTGPHTDSHGTDTFQYAFSYQNASEVWKNPCILLTPFEDSATSTFGIPVDSGGRNGYGPNGVNHFNSYGPHSQYQKTLDSTNVSIQGGLNGFEGQNQVGMVGARGRTIYPLRPASPQGNDFLSIESYYTYPFNPVDAIHYACPMPEEFDGVFTLSANYRGYGWYREDFGTGWGFANCSLDVSSGYAEITPTTTDPYFISPSFSAISTPNIADVIQLRFRVSADPGNAPWVGELRWRATASSPSWDALLTLSEPDGVRTGEWVVATWHVGADANWTGTIEQIRFDLFHSGSADTTVVEIDYATVLVTQDQRDSLYGNDVGACYYYLGQIPGVYRGTAQGVSTGQDSSIVQLGKDTYYLLPVWKTGQVGDRERPPRLIQNSGKASYVYKR